MKRFALFILATWTLCLNVLADNQPVHVFILAGQSNMEGHGFVPADPKRNGVVYTHNVGNLGWYWQASGASAWSLKSQGHEIYVNNGDSSVQQNDQTMYNTRVPLQSGNWSASVDVRDETSTRRVGLIFMAGPGGTNFYQIRVQFGSQQVPTLEKLHGLVDQFAEEVRWLDTPEDWKARFTLACAMQNLGDEMDEFFMSVQPEASLWLAEGIRVIEKEGIVTDDNRILAGTNTFFATRLFQRRLKDEKKWESEVAARVPKKAGKSFPADASVEEINQFRAELFRQSNAGNWLLDLIKKQSSRCNAVASLGNDGGLEERILNLGIQELNLILDAKRADGHKVRRP